VTLAIDVTCTPRDLGDWGALAGIVGRLAGDYWEVPVLAGIDRVPGSDEMKHLGAVLAAMDRWRCSNITPPFAASSTSTRPT
jgi:predicted aconitase